jgi:hypothetical protein
MRVGSPSSSSRDINGGIMSSHNTPSGLNINNARGQSIITERAYVSCLTSLSLYGNNSSWEGELHARFGHANHVRIHQDGGRHYPRSYMPPHQWWFDLAYDIRRMAYDGPYADTPHEVQFQAIIELCRDKLRGDSAYSFGYYVPNNLPSSQSPKHTEAMLFSAIAIELVWYGFDMLSSVDEDELFQHIDFYDKFTQFTNHILSMARQCYELAAPFFSTSRSINSNNFANTAISSALKAIKYFERIISQYISRHSMLERETAVELERIRQHDEEIRIARATAEQLQLQQLHQLKELELRKVIARQASELHHQQYNLRDDAAILIQKWHRGGAVRSCVAACKSRRARTDALVLGASLYANNIKAARPWDPYSTPTSMVSSSTTPPPPSNNRRSAHPFRDRGLALPRRKRRQRNRRPRNRPSRNRPPKKYRERSIEPSSSIPPPTVTTQDTDATSSLSSTASRCLSVPSTDEISPPQYHVKSSKGIVHCMPMCLWAAQSSAAMIKFDLTRPPAPVTSVPPPKAADPSATTPAATVTSLPVTNSYEREYKEMKKKYKAFLLQYKALILSYEREYKEMKQKYKELNKSVRGLAGYLTSVLVPLITNASFDLYHNHGIDQTCFITLANAYHANILQDDSWCVNKWTFNTVQQAANGMIDDLRQDILQHHSRADNILPRSTVVTIPPPRNYGLRDELNQLLADISRDAPDSSIASLIMAYDKIIRFPSEMG